MKTGTMGGMGLAGLALAAGALTGCFDGGSPAEPKGGAAANGGAADMDSYVRDVKTLKATEPRDFDRQLVRLQEKYGVQPLSLPAGSGAEPGAATGNSKPLAKAAGLTYSTDYIATNYAYSTDIWFNGESWKFWTTSSGSVDAFMILMKFEYPDYSSYGQLPAFSQVPVTTWAWSDDYPGRGLNPEIDVSGVGGGYWRVLVMPYSQYSTGSVTFHASKNGTEVITQSWNLTGAVPVRGVSGNQFAVTPVSSGANPNLYVFHLPQAEKPWDGWGYTWSKYRFDNSASDPGASITATDYPLTGNYYDIALLGSSNAPNLTSHFNAWSN